MFDGHDASLFFCGLLAAGVITLAAQSRAPDIENAIAIDTAALPSLPLTAHPDGAPAQTDVPARTLDLGAGFYATLLHGYVLEGEVVTRRVFRHDATSAVSPLDLGIVYGALDHGVAEATMEFRTGPRVIWFQANQGADLPRNWEDLVTNNHLIPASPEVREALMEVEPRQRVRIRGYLVAVTGEDISPWRSSTRRNDGSIIGGCEIILVRSVEVLPAAAA